MIGFWKKCNEIDDCMDNSDEIHCIGGKSENGIFVAKKRSINNGEFTIKALRSEKVLNFELNDNRNVKFLPIRIAEVFPKLEIFEAVSCNVKKLFFETFSSLRDLKVLNLSDNLIVDFEEFLFEDLASLEELNLAINMMVKVDKVIFRMLRNLIKLDLSLNQIISLDKETFQSLAKIQVINLSFNKLKSLQPETFAMNKRIVEIDLSGNELNVIPFDVFDNLNDLILVDLEMNKCVDKKFARNDKESKYKNETISNVIKENCR